MIPPLPLPQMKPRHCMAFQSFDYMLFLGAIDPDQRCDDLPHHVGLWLDVFAFAAIILQIILFASPYWSHIRDYTIAQHLDDDTDR